MSRLYPLGPEGTTSPRRNWPGGGTPPGHAAVTQRFGVCGPTGCCIDMAFSIVVMLKLWPHQNATDIATKTRNAKAIAQWKGMPGSGDCCLAAGLGACSGVVVMDPSDL